VDDCCSSRPTWEKIIKADKRRFPSYREKKKKEGTLEGVKSINQIDALAKKREIGGICLGEEVGCGLQVGGEGRVRGDDARGRPLPAATGRK